MNGDLSLSQVLGGLRIANPDDANDAHDASATPPTNEADTTPPTREFPASEVIQYGTQGIDIIDNGNQTAGPGTQASPASPNINNVAAQSSYARTPGSVAGSQRSVRYETQDSPMSAHQMQYAAGPGDPTHSRRTSRGRTASYGPVASLSGSTRSTAEEWKDRGAAVGVRREIDASGRTVVRQVKKGVRDFAFAHILGEGSYSTVYLATDRQTLKEFAIKVLEKRHIIKEKKIKYVNIEKDTLNRLTEHPGIVRLYYTFQDETSLYYVLDLCNGGELLGVLKKTGTFDVDCTRFYAAQILDAIDYMHSRGVIHRDLKPENVLLDDQMHIKITDFGTAKLLKDPRAPSKAGHEDQHPLDSNPEEAEDSRAASFVGTAEYVSPELLTHKNACKASDLWAFGCIVYQLLAGRPPFKAGSEYLTFQKIVNLEFEFPAGFPPAARDLVERCLVLDPARRLTIEHIKNHEFFEGQKFGRGLWRTKAPRLRPYVPPPQEPNIIQLNGFQSNQPKASHPTASHSTRQHHSASNGSARPSRIITELPPPTQLDIEWSPVLTRNNERILKLGDLMVISNPLPNGQNGKAPDEGHKKLSRFFGGNTTKKRQRLVMVTSSGRILLAPAGGDEKRSKHEISLLSSDCSWRTQRDAKGLLTWSVDSGGYHYSFEELKGANPEGGAASADGWIESLEKAKDMAVSQDMNSYGNDNDFADMTSTGLSASSTSGNRGNGQDGMDYNDKRSQLSKNQSGVDDPALKRHRFSKRQSRNGLGSAF